MSHSADSVAKLVGPTQALVEAGPAVGREDLTVANLGETLENEFIDRCVRRWLSQHDHTLVAAVLDAVRWI